MFIRCTTLPVSSPSSSSSCPQSSQLSIKRAFPSKSLNPDINKITEMLYLPILAFASLALSSPLQNDKRGCVAMAAEWFVQDFSVTDTPQGGAQGSRIVSFTFADSLGRSTHCGTTLPGDGSYYWPCDNVNQKFSFEGTDTIQLEQNVECGG